jgi:hypothetical protein
MVKPGQVRIFRPYWAFFALGWWEHSIVSSGQTTVLQEVPFGGYRFVFRWSDDFWNWNSSWWSWDAAISDVYALAPGSSTPINAGDVLLNPQRDPATGLFVLTVANDPSDGHYTFVRLPPEPGDYWQPLPLDTRPDVFQFP